MSSPSEAVQYEENKISRSYRIKTEGKGRSSFIHRSSFIGIINIYHPNQGSIDLLRTFISPGIAVECQLNLLWSGLSHLRQQQPTDIGLNVIHERYREWKSEGKREREVSEEVSRPGKESNKQPKD